MSETQTKPTRRRKVSGSVPAPDPAPAVQADKPRRVSRRTAKEPEPSGRVPFLISQSYINDAAAEDVCPKYLEYKYIDKIEQDNDEETRNVMFRGRYFEWHLLGATRDGIEPVFTPNKTAKTDAFGRKDYRPQAQIDIDALITYARQVIKDLGLSTSDGEKQVQIKADKFIGHIDWINKDFPGSGDAERDALYDVKYTETAVDDRYRGWADFETKTESKIQAVHYIILYYLKFGKYIPFYFLVFGKTKWVKVIKIELTSEGVGWHEVAVQQTELRTEKWVAAGWPANPEFNKCTKCGYYSFCKFKATVPSVEICSI